MYIHIYIHIYVNVFMCSLIHVFVLSVLELILSLILFTAQAFFGGIFHAWDMQIASGIASHGRYHLGATTVQWKRLSVKGYEKT